jgi:hypothetical protein
VITRQLFDRLGGFNAQRIAGEDVELCEQAVAAGQTILFDQRLAVYHYGEPRSVNQFLARELFHADPLFLVVGNVRRSVVDLTIAVLLLSLVVGAAGFVMALAFSTPAWLGLLVPALIVSAAAGLAKAAVKWHRGITGVNFMEMVALCQLMLLARAAGTIVRRKTWRSAPLEKGAAKASSD